MDRERDPLANAALIVAHPDDEALWFSSIVGRVSRVVVCYEDCADLPHLGPARRAVAQAYPLSTPIWLRQPEPCVLGRVDWKHPVVTDYGLALNAPEVDPESDRRYQRAFETVRTEIDVALRGFDNVFTHN